MKLLFAISLLVAITVEASYAASLYHASYQQATCRMPVDSCRDLNGGIECFDDVECQNWFGPNSRCCGGCEPGTPDWVKHCSQPGLWWPTATSSLQATGPDQCPEGQVFYSCGVPDSCRPTCQYPLRPCPRICIPGCQCPFGMVLDEITRRCMPLESCPQARVQDVIETKPPTPVIEPTTNEPAIYQQASCTMPVNSCFSNPTFGARCIDDAECQDRFGQGSRCCGGCEPGTPDWVKHCSLPNVWWPTAETALSSLQATGPDQCPEDQEFNYCGVPEHFAPTCKNLNPILPLVCVPGCQCRDGMVFLDEITKRCVPVESCLSAMVQDVLKTKPTTPVKKPTV